MHPIRSVFRASPSQSLLSGGGKRCLFKTPTGPAISRHRHAPCAATKMHHHSFPALFARGGTSNGLIIKRDDLPPRDLWHKILPAAMGSPDPYGQQLNGMGGGISSTSKICVLSPSDRPDADVDFTFVQVGVRDGALDMAGNCGNMLSAVGPAAWDWGFVPDAPSRLEDGEEHQEAVVRIFNTNTAKVIVSRFKVAGDPPRYCHEGDYEMDGVPGPQSRITLSFQHPAGAKTGRALPTGQAVDVLRLGDGSTVEASLVDVANPGVFVRAADLGFRAADPYSADLAAVFHPAAVEADPALKTRLEAIRRAGAERMGLDPAVESVPKIVALYPARAADGVDIRCLALSMGQAHKAVPLTLALCLGAAAGFPGTIAARLVRGRGRAGGSATVSIGHPSGRVDIGTVMRDGEIISAELHRTARFMMQGNVLY